MDVTSIFHSLLNPLLAVLMQVQQSLPPISG